GGSRARRAVVLCCLPVFLAATVVNRFYDGPGSARLPFAKGVRVERERVAYEGWNTHSQILVYRPRQGEPFFWGPGRGAEGLKAETARLVIDGDADTHVTRWDGDPASLSWVQYDVTAAPYHLRPGSDAAVIGVGGGRDVLTALWARSRSVTGIELN